ncbi:MAG: hypothetical protein OXR68_00100 [Alphaproteobacteria bacterium]|nr:hypothetical protein [Alphaproteobacteria bacterium]MDD9919012.1 hypothetical protein [Alphaproteobacteria bacterium]
MSYLQGGSSNATGELIGSLLGGYISYDLQKRQISQATRQLDARAAEINLQRDKIAAENREAEKQSSTFGMLQKGAIALGVVAAGITVVEFLGLFRRKRG